jgi:hypothetical protein
MLIRLVLFSVALQILNQPPQPQPTGEDLDWVDRNLVAARDQVMPFGRQGQAAAYRITKDDWTDLPESYFSIDRTYSYPTAAPNKQTLIATVTTMAANRLGGQVFPMSIRGQLLELHMADRSASLETVVLGMRVRRRQLTELQCPAIAHRMNALPSMSITLPGAAKSPVRPPALHPAAHQIIASTPGVYINATFTDTDISLVRWAIATMEDLQKCSG